MWNEDSQILLSFCPRASLKWGCVSSLFFQGKYLQTKSGPTSFVSHVCARSGCVGAASCQGRGFQSPGRAAVEMNAASRRNRYHACSYSLPTENGSMTTERLGPGGAFHDLQVHLTKQSSVGSFLILEQSPWVSATQRRHRPLRGTQPISLTPTLGGDQVGSGPGTRVNTLAGYSVSGSLRCFICTQGMSE